MLEYALRDRDGSILESGLLIATVENLLPRESALHQNFPNPFNPTTTIRFELPKASEVYLVVYDLMGREVTRLKEEKMPAGYHQVRWNGRDRYGRNLASGIYIVRLATPEYTHSIKTMLLK